MQKSSTTTLATPPCYQDQINVALDRLTIDEALHEVCAPELRNVLREELGVHISVPAKVFLDVVFCSEAMLLVKRSLPLQIARQVIVVGKVEALSEVLLDLFDDLADLFAVKLLVLGSAA